MIIDKVQYTSSNASMSVFGYVRGRPLGADELVHVTGVGTFEVENIYQEADPCPIGRRSESKAVVGAVLSVRNGARADKIETVMQEAERGGEGDDEHDDGNDELLSIGEEIDGMGELKGRAPALRDDAEEHRLAWDAGASQRAAA